MSQLVIYHGGGCSDGWASAWLFKRVFPDIELFPANYGDEPPDVRGKEVFVVDFSYPRSQMMRVFEQANGNVTVLDHHKSAEKELAGICLECAINEFDRFPTVTFDMKRSGAMLAWDFLNPSSPAPWIVRHVQARDLWTWEEPFSREVNAAIRSYPQTMEAWNELASRSASSLVPEGSAILRDQAMTVAAHVKNAWEIQLDGHKVLCVNATTLISEIAGELANGRAFGCCYFDRADGFRIWSLRSRGDSGIDASEVAKKFGGGGHKNAAGYQEDLRK